MPTLLPSKQVVVLGPELGLCVAMGSHEVVFGHLFHGKGFVPPPADLRTYPCDEGGDFLAVEALSSNGLAFLALMAGSLRIRSPPGGSMIAVDPSPPRL